MRVPHQVRNMDRPTVSKVRARAPTATVSSGRFSVKTWAMICNMLESSLSSVPLPQAQTYRWSGRSSEDQGTKVGSALVAHGASGVDESADTVGLESRASEGGTPSGGCGCGLLGLDEVLSGVGGLRAAVGVAEERAHDSERCSMVENGAQGNGRWLDWWEVYDQETMG